MSRLEHMIFWFLLSAMIVLAVVALMLGMSEWEGARAYIITDEGILKLINIGS